ncbi:probable envelope ADP,ATP carrier protein, chloroplastic, partial [Tanacetum coccineum]
MDILFHLLCRFYLLFHMSKPQMKQQEEATLTWKHIPKLQPHHNLFQCRSHDAAVFAAGALSGAAAKTVTAPLDRIKRIPPWDKTHISITMCFYAAVFGLYACCCVAAGALSAAAAKTLLRPLRLGIKNHLGQFHTQGLRVGQESAKKAIGFLQAFVSVGKQEGLKGYWKGNFAQ